MAVTNGDYITSTAIQGYIPTYSGGWDSNTSPSDSQVTQFIIEVEAMMNGELAALGFTVPITGASSIGLKLLGNIGSRLVAAKIAKASTAGNSNAYGGEPSAYFQELETFAFNDFKRIVGDSTQQIPPNPMILINSGITSTYTPHSNSLISTYLLDNPGSDTGPDITLTSEF
tara:strand:+ start:22510 stop:23025 length:516 start_codon:yes stop_codon:yes gene_type:complete